MRILYKPEHCGQLVCFGDSPKPIPIIQVFRIVTPLKLPTVGTGINTGETPPGSARSYEQVVRRTWAVPQAGVKMMGASENFDFEPLQ